MSHSETIFGRLRKSESGASLMMVVVFAVVLFGFAALSVDVGNVYVHRARIQAAGDAAVLAAVKDWAMGAGSSATRQTGNDFVVSNGALTNEVVSIEVGRWDNGTKTFIPKDPLTSADVPAVRITLRRTVRMAFAGVVGIREMTPRTVSMAIAAQARAAFGVLPWAACTNGVPAMPPKCGRVTLKNGNECSGPGNFGALALGERGADSYEYNIISNYQGRVRIGDVIDTEPGNMTGPTRKGLAQRIAGAPPYACSEDSTARRNGRFGIVPVTGDLGDGRSPVTIVGFWTFALDDPSGGHVTGNFIQVFTGGDIDPTKPPTVGLLNGVALVQ